MQRRSEIGPLPGEQGFPSLERFLQKGQGVKNKATSRARGGSLETDSQSNFSVDSIASDILSGKKAARSWRRRSLSLSIQEGETPAIIRGLTNENLERCARILQTQSHMC